MDTEPMTLTIGISPCPNDTFIFDALFSKKIDLGPYTLEFILKDVEELNEMALKNELDIVKISYAHYPRVIPDYIMFRSGGAMGRGVGPLLVSSSNLSLPELSTKTIALPGEHTTAHFLFSTLFPEVTQKRFMLFSLIEEAVLCGKVDAGVLIHEGRFTYADKGLVKLADLGERWQALKNLPLPLGGIAIRRSLIPHHQNLQALIRNSIRYAFQYHRNTLSDFVTQHAQEMEDDVMRQHIHLYVNEFSEDVGALGQQAVEDMLGLSSSNDLPIFVP